MIVPEESIPDQSIQQAVQPSPTEQLEKLEDQSTDYEQDEPR